MPLSTQQVLQLAPDAAAAKAGQGLAKLAQWQQLGQCDNLVWGLCQGSGKEPYRTQVDLGEPAFKCSCPSRKFPCKHGLGLLLLLAQQDAAFVATAVPDWVQAWQTSRNERAEKAILKQQIIADKSADKSADQPPADGAAAEAAPALEGAPGKPQPQNKRAAQRQARVAAGVEDAMRWIEDLLRTGLVAARGQPYAYWDGAAARLVDAQAPALARRVRQLPQCLRGDDWHDTLLAELGKLYLLMQSLQRIDTLTPQTQADVRAAIGWTVEQQQLQQQAVPMQNWQVMALCSEQEDQLVVRRTWLQQIDSGEIALLLDFMPAHAPRSGAYFAPGFQLQAELVYYPGAVAQRAVLKPGFQLQERSASCRHGWHSIDGWLAQAAAQLAHNPWLERSACLLHQMHLVQRAGQWHVRDAAGDLLPLAAKTGAQIWLLHAIAGGAALDMFGEWDSRVFWPRSYWHAGNWHPLAQEGT